MIALDSSDSDDLACGSQHKEQTARLAPVVGVHSRVGLLISLVLEILVLAVGHWYRPVDERILAFGGTSALGGIRR